MDTDGKIKKMTDKKGITLIVVALLIVILVAFVGLAVDIGYMYVAKGQLQNAADAAALAGAAKLDGSNLTAQTAARQAAFTLASSNVAVPAKTAVKLANDGTNTTANFNAGLNDILVGKWNGVSFSNISTPINAVMVRARRTTSSPGGQVVIFFGKLLGWTQMSASATAIAALTQPFIAPIPTCLPSCGLQTPIDAQWNYDKNAPDPNEIYCTDTDVPAGGGPGQLFDVNSSAQSGTVPQPGMGWTAFDTFDCPNSCPGKPTKNSVEPYIFGTQLPPPICGKNICTTNGTINPLLGDVQTMFNAHAKNFTFTSNGKNITVKGWQVTIPIVSNSTCGQPGQTCPGAQGGTANPYLVVEYANVLITGIEDTSQHGVRMIGMSNPQPFTTTVNCGKKDPTHLINRTVTTVTCTDCNLPQPGGSTGVKLVK